MEAPCRTEEALRLSEPPKGAQSSSCPCQGARYGSRLGYSRWFEPQPIAAEQQMNFPADIRNEKDNKITVILTYTVWRWAVLFPNNRQPEALRYQRFSYQERGVSWLLACPKVKTRAPCRLVPTSHPHSPTAIAGLTSFPRFRLASRLEPSTISSSCFFKVSS